MMWRLHRKPSRASSEATEAHALACRSLRDVENLGLKVDVMVGKIAITMERNHFAEAVAQAIQGE